MADTDRLGEAAARPTTKAPAKPAPGSEDGDKDGLTDAQEAKLGTDPNNYDTDGDDLPDGEEVKAGTDPFKTDTDGDGISDKDELTFGSNPLSTDTDGDGFSDTQEYEWGWENRRGAGAHIPTPANATADDIDGDGVSNATEKHFGMDPTVDSSKAEGGPGDAAVARQLYETEKTGDPIGDADLRQQYGIPSTPEEDEQLADQQFDAAFSDNVLQRERFYESTGAPGPAEHQAELAKFLDDRAKAEVDRDPKAFEDARDALGLPTTQADLDHFNNPGVADVLGAARSSELTGVPIPEDSKLGTMLPGAIATAMGTTVHADDVAMPQVGVGGTTTGIPSTSTGTNSTGTNQPGTSTNPGSTNDTSGNDPGASRNEFDPSRPAVGGSNGTGSSAPTGTGNTNPGGATNPGPANPGGATNPGPANTGSPAASTTPEGSDVVVKDGEGNTYVNHPDGSATTYDSGGNVTYDSSAEKASLAATGSTSNWKDYVDPGRASGAPTGGGQPAGGGTNTGGGADTDEGDENPDDDGQADDDTEDSDDSDDGSDDSDDSGSDDGDEPDDDSDEGMRDPESADNTSGVSADGGDVLGRIHGSSTGIHGGATDGGRGDLDNGLGPVTGELRGTNTAGPDVNPDSDTGGDGGNRMLGRTPDGPEVIDGPRPDLAEFVAHPEGPPTDDGVNPYASSAATETEAGGGKGTGTPPSEGGGPRHGMTAVDAHATEALSTFNSGPTTPPGGFNDTADVSRADISAVDISAVDISAAHIGAVDAGADVEINNPSLDLDVAVAPDDGFAPEAEVGFGGPLDDGFD
jgi:hypothetical protein